MRTGGGRLKDWSQDTYVLNEWPQTNVVEYFLCTGSLNGIKVRAFFGKNIEKKHLYRHGKNSYYFCKSNIPVINLIVGFRNMMKASKNMSL